ncbi:hypothetical protein ACVWVZ_004950 [Pseudomonas tolaasii]
MHIGSIDVAFIALTTRAEKTNYNHFDIAPLSAAQGEK